LPEVFLLRPPALPVLFLDLLLFEEVVTGLVLPHGGHAPVFLLIALEGGELSYLRVHGCIQELEEGEDILLDFLVAADQEVLRQEHPTEYLVIL